MNNVITYLQKQGFTDESRLLSQYHHDDERGFYSLTDTEFDDMMSVFADDESYQNLIPILTDNESNYWCLYADGTLKGRVCHLGHGGEPICPAYHHLHTLFDVIKGHADAYDFYDLQADDLLDFPVKADFDERAELLARLYDEFCHSTSDELRSHLAFAVLTLCLPQDIDKYITPLLDDEDDNIQYDAKNALDRLS